MNDEIASAIESCRAALDAAEMRACADALRSKGFTDSSCVTLIEQVGIEVGAADRIADLRDTSAEQRHAAILERYLLLLTVSRYGARIAQGRMTDGVRQCLADELRFLASPSDQDTSKLLAPFDGFTAMAKVVTLRRFPVGQLHFELSGIPLSWLLHLGPARLTKVLFYLAGHGRARRPFLFHHVAWRRRNRLFLSEQEQNRSYFRMAQSLALYPEVKGLLTESWLHSPETLRVSPHLAWLNRPFLEHGGLVVELGEAPEASGILIGSLERRRLYDQGQFRPTTAMAIWPRAAMLDWARRHPEFGD
ncbi:MAG TPA: hypothetical protein VJN70_13075 [Gemmatimonadaceae bacterium]|nr:hypothetical protein [Gemmatimonadaceae bacterium]